MQCRRKQKALPLDPPRNHCLASGLSSTDIERDFEAPTRSMARWALLALCAALVCSAGAKMEADQVRHEL